MTLTNFLTNRAAALPPMAALRPLVASLSSILLLLSFFAIYYLFHNFDWGHAFTKFLSFMSAFVILKHISNRGQQVAQHPSTHMLEITIGTGLIVLLCALFVGKYGNNIVEPPWVDIGYTTVNAAKGFWHEMQNPYQSTTINARPELADKHRGFHYGPTMFLAYSAAAFWGGVGYKLTSLFFLAVAMVSTLLLVKELSPKHASSQYLFASSVLAIALLLAPERFWYEILRQGANDIMPVSLLLLGIYLFHKQNFLSAGIILGLSFSAKFAPAAFFLFLLIRRQIPIPLIIGGLIGCLPLWFFLLWDSVSLLENVFILRASLNYNSTSIYSLLPQDLHFLFKYVILSALLFFVGKNFLKPFDLRQSVIDLTLFLIIIEVTFKEMHTNHLIWFYPFFSILVVTHRHWLLFSFDRLTDHKPKAVDGHARTHKT